SSGPAVADLRPAADSMWRLLQRPFALDSASSDWFAMSPERVSLAPLNGNGPTIGTAIMVTARPRVIVGPKPATDVRPLPSLTLAPKSTGVHVPLEIEIPFEDLSKRATALLGGEVAGQGIRGGDISVSGIGRSV